MAPLAEIVAEVRWTDPSVFMLPGQNISLSEPNNSADEFYMRFGGVAYSKGFKRAERLIPPGFPIPMGQVVYRYRPAEDSEDKLARSAMWQIGPGVFAANAIPPYKSWREFSPWVEAGIGAMIETRSEKERSSHFSTVSLRYIDAFTEDYLEGATFAEFLRDKLGFKVKLPDVFNSKLKIDSDIEHIIQFSFPVEGDMTLAFSASQGKFKGADALIVSIQVSCDKPVNPELNFVMQKLHAARNIIHDIFFEMTGSLHTLMKPTNDGGVI